MIFYLLPNLVIAIIALLSFGFQLGWDKFKQYPYILIPLYLFITAIGALWIKWDEPKENEDERKQFVEDIKKAVSEGVMEALKQDRESRNDNPK